MATKKLSKVQQETLDKMTIGVYYCAYDLKCSIATLEVLCYAGYIREKAIGFYEQLFDSRTKRNFKRIKQLRGKGAQNGKGGVR